MKKRVLSFLLAVCLLFAASTALAEVGNAEFTTETQETLLGTTVSLKITAQLNANDGEALNTWRAVLSYDDKALTYEGFAITDELTRETSIAGLDSLWAVNDETPGRLVIGFSNAYGCKEDGYLVTLLFRSKAVGSYAIDMKDVVYSTYRASDSGVTVYTKVDSVLTTLTVLDSFPEPTGTPSPEPTSAPTDTPTPSATATITPTQTPEARPTDAPEPTRVPTATPTRKPRQTPTVSPSAIPTDVPTEAPTDTPTPTAVPTDVPTETPTSVPTEIPTAEPTDQPRNGFLVTDGEGGCSTFGNASLGILLLDIGIAFLALQIIIVVLIILRKRRKMPHKDADRMDAKDEDENPEDLDFRK